jgi:hypothetical protein
VAALQDAGAVDQHARLRRQHGKPQPILAAHNPTAGSKLR